MNKNLGIYLNLTFGIITFAIGIYYLKTLIFLSLIFFIATIANLLLLYREYYIQNRLMTNLNSLRAQEELQVKNSKSISLVNFLSYLIFISVSIFFINLLLKNQPENFTTIAMMPIGAIVFSLILIFLEIRKINSIVIRMNRKGIQIHKRSLMNWNDIENEKIISRTFTAKETRHDFKSEVNYLCFYFKNERIEIRIDDLNITDSELSQYLKIYRKNFNQGLQKSI